MFHSHGNYGEYFNYTENSFFYSAGVTSRDELSAMAPE
jgi:hypothetical protein